MYLIKIGSLYLTSTGDWSPYQKDALRIQSAVHLTGVSMKNARVVTLKPRRF